jgi:hypothetical protein
MPASSVGTMWLNSHPSAWRVTFPVIFNGPSLCLVLGCVCFLFVCALGHICPGKWNPAYTHTDLCKFHAQFFSGIVRYVCSSTPRVSLMLICFSCSGASGLYGPYQDVSLISDILLCISHCCLGVTFVLLDRRCSPC